MKILVVEDDPMVVDTIKDMLSELHYPVIATADSYDSALAAIKKLQPDLALVDIELKGSLTGIDLGKRLGQIGIHHMYLTGQQDPNTLIQASRTYPLRNLPKPVRILDLRNALFEIDLSKKPSETPVIYLINEGEGDKIRIEPDNIVYVKADDSYTHIYSYSPDRSKLVKQTYTRNMKTFLERLDWPHIIKIHRSHAINIRHIEKSPQGNWIEMKTGIKLEVSLKYRSRLDPYLKLL